MLDKFRSNGKSLVVFVVVLSTLIFSYVILILLNYKFLKKYDEMVLPGSYVLDYGITNLSFSEVREKLNLCQDEVLSKKVKLLINDKEYEYSLKEIGVNLDVSKTVDNIVLYQKKLSNSKKLRAVNGGEKKIFKFFYVVDDNKLLEFLNSFKVSIDTASVDGYFDTSTGVKYVEGIDGHSLNVLGSLGKIKDAFLKEGDYNQKISLVVDVLKANSNDSYKSIDTLTSSFVTKFNVWEGTRPINLRTALNYINGAIVEPGEIFSYYKYAGPYNKSGYVFYYEFVGNGVCQIATTVYNAALLGGLSIVKRYPHAKKSVYVPGGLDATVASYSSGWNVDFQFKNTYKYPIYIKAFANGGEAHVEFWSSHEAMEGKSYSTESVQIGQRGYTTYLHTYKDGVEIDRSKIATTWYTEE